MAKRHAWNGGDTCIRCGLKKITGEPGHVVYERPGASRFDLYIETAGPCEPAQEAK